MIHLIILLAIFGFIAWLILQIHMPPIFKNIIVGVICIVAVIYLLQAIGVDTGFGRMNLK